MKVLYIGQYSDGTTSKMRADVICDILNPDDLNVIDTNIPFFKTPKLWRTIGFRFKIGQLISEINYYILEVFNTFNTNIYDLIWVDKAVFIKPETTVFLKSKSKRLVHFTPDMAFFSNSSMFFRKSMCQYDFLITTKTAEIDLYQKWVGREKVILTTQGFSKAIHKPVVPFDQKIEAVCFVGLAEQNRIEVIDDLLEAGISVKLAGKGWNKFIKRHREKENLEFMGDGLFGVNYTNFISSCQFSLGLLSKKFPERHTTRTFEIPACGTALLTEKNEEISSFFDESEVIYFNNNFDLIEKLRYYSKHRTELQKITINGHIRVNAGDYNYRSLLSEVLEVILE